MSTLIEILSPGFLLHDALVASVLVGLVCPLVGVYFVLRRMIFLGVALPQVSAAGIAFSFLAYRALVGPHEAFEVGERFLAMIGSVSFTLIATLVLSMFERGGHETVEARIGTLYAMAAAATIIFLAKDPHGDAQMVSLLKGDILATTSASLTSMTIVFGLVIVALFAFRKELVLVSFDRDLAVVFGKRVEVWDALLYVRGHDRRADGHIRLPRRTSGHHAHGVRPHADLLRRLRSLGCGDGVWWLLLRLPFRPASGPR